MTATGCKGTGGAVADTSVAHFNLHKRKQLAQAQAHNQLAQAQASCKQDAQGQAHKHGIGIYSHFTYFGPYQTTLVH